MGTYCRFLFQGDECRTEPVMENCPRWPFFLYSIARVVYYRCIRMFQL